MFFSLMAYLFLALIYNEIHRNSKTASLISTIDYLKDININYAIKGKIVTTKIECKSDIAVMIRDTMEFEKLAKY